jgi:hypothetical protein
MRKVFQFKITLLGIEPPIWRRVQISDLCTFWTLHVAIQDAMGWQDCHMHEFIITAPGSNRELHIGIPFDDDPDEYRPLAGWELMVRHYIQENPFMAYLYDFGDSWMHRIEFEGEHDKVPGTKYPICLDGKRKCPPEDVGSITGYNSFVKSLKDKNHPQHKINVRWIGGKFDPEQFDAGMIKFSRASVRLNQLMEEN